METTKSLYQRLMSGETLTLTDFNNNPFTVKLDQFAGVYGLIMIQGDRVKANPIMTKLQIENYLLQF